MAYVLLQQMSLKLMVSDDTSMLLKRFFFLADTMLYCKQKHQQSLMRLMNYIFVYVPYSGRHTVNKDFSKKGKGHFAPLKLFCPFELGIIMNLHIHVVSSCTQQSVLLLNILKIFICPCLIYFSLSVFAYLRIYNTVMSYGEICLDDRRSFHCTVILYFMNAIHISG